MLLAIVSSLGLRVSSLRSSQKSAAFPRADRTYVAPGPAFKMKEAHDAIFNLPWSIIFPFAMVVSVASCCFDIFEGYS